MKIFLRTLTLFLFSAAAAAQPVTDEDRFYRLERTSLEKLLNMETSVASRVPVELRRTPGVVTVITAEDIELSGARNLVDLLRLIPDFEFVSDVQGNIGISARGNSAIEGKVRVIWDGQTFNELLYGTVQFDRFPVDQIERIEIIKGPGSVIYGGMGELAVINMVTRTPGSLDGSRAYAAYGHMKEARGRAFGGYQFGRIYGDAAFSALAHVSKAQRSDRTYRDFSGGSYDMDGNSELESRNLNLFLQKKDFSLRFIADEYSLLERDHWGTVLSTGATRIKFPVYSLEAKGSFGAGADLRVEPRISFQYSKPWNENDEHFPYDKTVRHYAGGLAAFYDTDSPLNLMAGAELERDEVEVGARTSADSSYGGGRNGAWFENLALFAQTTLDLPVLTFTAGGRLDSNSATGSDFSPRLAVTGRVDEYHFKAIYSGGFRKPTAENLRITPSIKPEHTTAVELEAGREFGENFFASVNAFDITIDDTILYYSGPVEDYLNSGRTGTRGYGLDLKFNTGRAHLELLYSAYSASRNTVAYTMPPDDKSAMLGVPRHKAVLNSRFSLSERVSLSPSLIYLSRRYGYHTTGAVKAYGGILQTNIYLHARGLFADGLNLGLGAHDLFGSGYSHIQSYDGGHAPLPSASREIFVKAAYAF
ncbi:MAG: TonB-dependent receptor plug domain-containing protein [Elusimicrobiales bacterium]|nr:TonB-dependent receptor plug domain-containing protein [Elusimicrobiales bacterium]